MSARRKSPASKRRVVGRELAASPGSQFWVIDTESPGENLNSLSATGPFDSLRTAEAWLRNDAADTYMAADKSLRDLGEGDTWAKPVHIVKVIKTVRQVPTATVTVRLETANDLKLSDCEGVARAVPNAPDEGDATK